MRDERMRTKDKSEIDRLMYISPVELRCTAQIIFSLIAANTGRHRRRLRLSIFRPMEIDSDCA
jgi:hypothetical protein